jgi:hypothetical protein
LTRLKHVLVLLWAHKDWVIAIRLDDDGDDPSYLARSPMPAVDQVNNRKQGKVLNCFLGAEQSLGSKQLRTMQRVKLWKHFIGVAIQSAFVSNPCEFFQQQRGRWTVLAVMLSSVRLCSYKPCGSASSLSQHSLYAVRIHVAANTEAVFTA